MSRWCMGQGTVEFALTVPVLVLIVLGIFDVGRAVWYYNNLAEATREATRYAMVHGASSSSPVGPGSGSYTAPNSDSVVTGVVWQFSFGMDTNHVAVQSTWPDGDNKSGHRVNVAASYTYVPLSSPILGGISIPLNSSAATTIAY